MTIPDDDSGVFSIDVAAEKMKELLPVYEQCDGFGCILTANGIIHDPACSRKEEGVR